MAEEGQRQEELSRGAPAEVKQVVDIDRGRRSNFTWAGRVEKAPAVCAAERELL